MRRRILPGLLIAAALLWTTAAARPATGALTVRVTSYLPTGNPTASGHWPYSGSAACSRLWPLYTWFRLPDGREVICLDRGHGDYYWPAGWIDLYATSAWEVEDNRQRYGDWIDVEVLDGY